MGALCYLRFFPLYKTKPINASPIALPSEEHHYQTRTIHVYSMSIEWYQWMHTYCSTVTILIPHCKLLRAGAMAQILLPIPVWRHDLYKNDHTTGCFFFFCLNINTFLNKKKKWSKHLSGYSIWWLFALSLFLFLINYCRMSNADWWPITKKETKKHLKRLSPHLWQAPKLNTRPQCRTQEST